MNLIIVDTSQHIHNEHESRKEQIDWREERERRNTK